MLSLPSTQGSPLASHCDPLRKTQPGRPYHSHFLSRFWLRFEYLPAFLLWKPKTSNNPSGEELDETVQFMGNNRGVFGQDEPLLPPKERNPVKRYQRRPGGVRRLMEQRTTREGIFYVLPTGILWNARPARFRSPCPVYRCLHRQFF